MIDIGRNEDCVCGSGKKFKKCCLPYSDNIDNGKKNILLYIGNGFTLNYLDHFNIELNSSKPLAGFCTKNISYEDIFSYYNEIKDYLNDKNLEQDNFKIIDHMLNSFSGDDALQCYFNRFLTIAYSKFQLELHKYNKINDWDITKWLHLNRNYISDIVSLNYDLHLENCLKEAGISYKRNFTKEEPYLLDRIVNVYKPHGSIDFDILNSIISCPDEMRWRTIITRKNVTMNGDTYQDIVGSDRWLLPRIQSDIIPPSQYNNLLDFSWIKQTYLKLSKDITKIDSIINIGFSYSKVDQKEYNHLIESIKSPKVIKVIDINRSENQELKDYLNRFGHEYKFVGLKLPWRVVDII
jgi:hypothetical protein